MRAIVIAADSGELVIEDRLFQHSTYQQQIASVLGGDFEAHAFLPDHVIWRRRTPDRSQIALSVMGTPTVAGPVCITGWWLNDARPALWTKHQVRQGSLVVAPAIVLDGHDIRRQTTI
jgi:hypothetical protein